MKSGRIVHPMLSVHTRTPGGWVILLVSVIHMAWAAVLLYGGGEALNATPLSFIGALTKGNPRLAAMIYAGASALAIWGTAGTTFSRMLALLPQQALTMFSASSGLNAAFAGHFADGEVRSWPFILADQMAEITLALVHSTAVYWRVYTNKEAGQ